jgi:hypothetical protein
MKQTAIQEMINEFNKELNVATQIGNEDKIRITKHLINIAALYLPKEEQQIIDAIRYTEIDIRGYYNEGDAEFYYNETFKSE